MSNLNLFLMGNFIFLQVSPLLLSHSMIEHQPYQIPSFISGKVLGKSLWLDLPKWMPFEFAITNILNEQF